MRFRLKTLLVLVALSGPLAAILLRPYLVPDAVSVASNVDVPGGLLPIRAVVVYERSATQPGVRIAIVMPGTIPLESSRATRLQQEPLSSGVSIRGPEVYLYGKHCSWKQVPCFAVLDPVSRTFEEIPIESPRSSITPEGLVNLPEWKSHVAPIIDRMEADHLKRLVKKFQ